ncbi:uncharacterized protein [Solanum lycopersicum]|uniref:uncharacterized protein n=1 Tax=Solanum lycopersicum TaxID=4081 RepID=UPI0002BCBCFD|nr:uncharacterized protein LOC109120683 [Solanum lycopersicum]
MVEDHLICHGFVQGYTKWVFHGEGFSSRNTPHPTDEEETSNMHDDIDRLLHDTFRNVVDDQRHEGVREGPHEDAKRFYKLVEEGKEDLYPGYLLDLIREALPFAQIPDSFYKAKKVIKDLGLHYEKIHACTNDCILFWNDNAKLDNCSVCGASRWKNVRNDLNNKVTRIPVKVLRHPADGEAWKDFDSLHPDFANNARNVRLGISSDGFNPFRTMSISHSTWPVMLMNYNLSPWTCMKSENIMLSMIIPSPSSPENDIDVYLQPLIAELKELWEVGVEIYDAVTNQTFLMHAALLWTISDFLALAMLSGWSTKGRLACPTCNHNTCYQYLKNSRKMFYLGHQTFLPPDHPFIRDKRSFNGKEEHKVAPTPLSGAQILEELREFNNVFGKNKKKRKQKNDGNIHLAKACFSMTPDEKKLFCTILKDAKLPTGCASNISCRVQIAEMKVSGYKSHNAHFIMHYLHQVAVRKVLPKNVAMVLIRLGNYFRAICSKVIRRSDLDKMKAEIIDIECELEKIFPPSFFDIMTHLPIHLVDEIKL